MLVVRAPGTTKKVRAGQPKIPSRCPTDSHKCPSCETRPQPLIKVWTSHNTLSVTLTTIYFSLSRTLLIQCIVSIAQVELLNKLLFWKLYTDSGRAV